MKLKKASSILTRIIISAVLMFLLFYSMLPAINLRDRNFIIYLISCIVIFLVVNFLTYVKDFIQNLSSGRGMELTRDPVTGQVVFRKVQSEEKNKINMGKPLKFGFIAIAVLVAFMILASALGLKVFNAARYRDLITITDGNFTTDVSELNMSQIPVVDKDTASRLGSKKLGEMTELVSQFEILNNYTQINYKGIPYRVTPLSYADPVKWLYNMRTGLPAYIAVDMVNQDVYKRQSPPSSLFGWISTVIFPPDFDSTSSLNARQHLCREWLSEQIWPRLIW